MATIFPADPQVNDEYQGYRYNGTSWDIIGIDLTADYQPRVTGVSNTEIGYLDGVTSAIQTQINAKQTIVSGVSDTEIGYLDGVTSSIQTQLNAKQAIVSGVSDTEIGYLDGVTSAIQTQINAKASLSGATFTGNTTAPEVHASTKLVADTVGGDEGGEILLGKPATNTTVAGTGVTLDLYQNRLRIFEQGGDARGAYLDITKLSNGVASPISTIDSGSTVKTMSIKENQTQAVYGTTGYNFYNQPYTTNSKVSCKLLITFGVCYECNLDTDGIQLAVSLNGTDEFTFSDTQKSAQYNEMPFYTFISTNSYSPSTTISNLRVYIKSLTGNVVCPRNAGTLHNFFLTVQEIAV